MPESFKTQRYEDRPSSKLGFSEYLSQHVVWLFLPVAGFLAGLGLRKVTRIPMLEEVSQGLGGILDSKASRDALRQEANAAGSYIPRKAEMWGGLLGGAYGAFRLWRANTKQQLEVDTLSKDVEALRGMESANAHLAIENEQLAKQIRFSDRHARPAASHVAQLEAASESAAHMQR